MTLTGEYTLAGAQLAAKIQAGAAALNLTRAAAGPGVTPPEAAAMASEKQALSLQAHSLSGTTLTVPVQLLSVNAPEAYTMREIGLYAKDSGGAEMLYKLYRFDQAVSVSPLCSLTATFYLNDTVVAGSQPTVEVTAQGLLTGADIPGIVQQTTQSIGTFSATAKAISCTLDQLTTTISTLPRLVTADTTITVTGGGTTTKVPYIRGFYGPGTLTITGAAKVSLPLIELSRNSLSRITLNNMAVGAVASTFFDVQPDILSPYRYCTVRIMENTGLVDLRNMDITHPNPTMISTAFGVYVNNCRCVLTAVRCTDVGVAVGGFRMANIIYRSVGATGAANLSYVFRLYNGSTLVWPGAASTLSTQTGCANYNLASGSRVLWGDGTSNIASGFTTTEF